MTNEKLEKANELINEIRAIEKDIKQLEEFGSPEGCAGTIYLYSTKTRQQVGIGTASANAVLFIKDHLLKVLQAQLGTKKKEFLRL